MTREQEDTIMYETGMLRRDVREKFPTWQAYLDYKRLKAV